MGKLFGVELKSITQAYIDQAARELHPGVKPTTLNRIVYTPFVAVWNHAVANEWTDDRRWKRPTKKKKGTRQAIEARIKRVGSYPTTYERAEKFVLATSPANAIVMTILFYTGMRPIELFLMHSDQVNVKDRWITLPQSKIGEPRGVPIHRFLIPLLTALKKRGGMLVRTWEGEDWTVVEGNGGQMKKAIANARSRTGIGDISPNTARHTVSTRLAVNGIHPHVKDQILGHAVDDMSRNYTDVPRKELIKAIDTLPVFQKWAAAPWMSDPVGQASQRQKPLTKAQKAKLSKVKAA
jgi:integrase